MTKFEDVEDGAVASNNVRFFNVSIMDADEAAYLEIIRLKNAEIELKNAEMELLRVENSILNGRIVMLSMNGIVI